MFVVVVYQNTMLITHLKLVLQCLVFFYIPRAETKYRINMIRILFKVNIVLNIVQYPKSHFSVPCVQFSYRGIL